MMQMKRERNAVYLTIAPAASSSIDVDLNCRLQLPPLPLLLQHTHMQNIFAHSIFMTAFRFVAMGEENTERKKRGDKSRVLIFQLLNRKCQFKVRNLLHRSRTNHQFFMRIHQMPHLSDVLFSSLVRLRLPFVRLHVISARCRR